MFKYYNKIKILNERWITVKPHGEDEKGRHLLLEGYGESQETPIQAMKRQWGIDLKEKKKSESSEKKSIQLNDFQKKYEYLRDLRKSYTEEVIKYNKIIEERNRFVKDPKTISSYYKILEKDGTVAAKKWIDEELNKRFGSIDKSKIEELNKTIKEKQENIVNEKSKKIGNWLKSFSKKNDNIVKDLEQLNSPDFYKTKSLLNEKHKKLNEAYSSFEKEKKKIEVFAQEVAPLLSEIKTLEEKIKNENNTNPKVFSDILRKGFNSGFKVKTRKSSIKDFDNILGECLNGCFSENYKTDVPVDIKKRKNIRSYYDRFNENIVFGNTDSVKTMIHEYVHYIENNNPQMLINSLSFLQYRTQGDTIARLGKGYSSNEITKKDNFFNKYCGKIYSDDYSYTRADATELMSMGVERIFTDPVGFSREDREYFDFVIANMRGEIDD